MPRKPRPISGAGPRLKQVLDERGISVRLFTGRMKGIRGAHYSSVWSYLLGRVEPPEEFLEAAARELDLRPDYLLRGELPKYIAQERVRGPGDPRVDDALQRSGWSDATRALFHEAWGRQVAAVPRDEVITDALLLEMGMDLLGLVELPQKLWGFAHDLKEPARNDAAVALLHALMLLMPAAGAGDRVELRGRLYAEQVELTYLPDREQWIKQYRVRTDEHVKELAEKLEKLQRARGERAGREG
jgi:hypothetical protein